MNDTALELKLFDYHPARKDMLQDVLRGLRSPEKWISSMYFYDERGSQLFDEICELPEYYPTRTELAIMERYIGAMTERLGPGVMLVEFGSGSSMKTRILLQHLDDLAAYVPVEISREHLVNSARQLQEQFPDIELLPVCADFTQDFEVPASTHPPLRKVMYFPGSTIGNFDPDDALDLLQRMARLAGSGGGVLIGVDLEKDPAVLERAYNDAAGITAQFNLNILERINRELGADFNPDRFAHRAVWNPQRFRIEMHLISETEQTVHIRGHEIRFARGETIHTESSYKFTFERFANLAAQAGLTVEEVWTDEKRMFSVQYLTVTSDE